MMHPSESDLTLYAHGDLSLLERWRVSRHVHGCGACGSAVQGYRDAATVLKMGLDELPAGTNWDRLAREMTGNIGVGLAAGECVDTVPIREEHRGWRAAAVICSASAVLAVAWLLNIPRPAVIAPTVALNRTESGIQLKEGGGAMTLLHTRASSPVISSSSPGQLRARYVDADTEQVTINNVYAQ